MILYQVYAFVLPAFSPTERQVATPLLLMVPFLFIAGVVFCYFVVLPPATDFLLSFNADEFNTQVRARDYYSFVHADDGCDGPGLPGAGRDPRGRAGSGSPRRRSCARTAATRSS